MLTEMKERPVRRYFAKLPVVRLGFVASLGAQTFGSLI
jgi:hypothetical protein